MQTRRLYKEDKELLLNLNAHNLNDDRRNRIIDFIDDSDNYFLAALDNNHVIGFLLAYKLKRYDGLRSMLYVHEVDVKESYRRQGVATKLFDEIKRISKNEELMKIFLITNESNIAAMNLYAVEGGIRNEADEVVFEFKEF